ncbi:MAG: patatin-like phospholipase family protein [Flavobacteriales bacterium]
MKHCLIVEGGGFKTGFTTGVLDAFLCQKFNPFDSYIGVSGGTIALSYFLSQQYRLCISTIQSLARDAEFTKFSRTFGKEGYMNIDFISEVSKNNSFDLEKAFINSENARLHFVATNKNNGQAEYLIPNRETWIDSVIASCTMPFITKGEHKVEGKSLFDGGWSDALPVKWAYDQGARNIIVLRTNPRELRLTQSWADYFGSKYHKPETELGSVFAKSHEWYNESVEFLENPPKDANIQQIGPLETLKSGSYTYSANSIIDDYRNGLDMGLSFLNQ